MLFRNTLIFHIFLADFSLHVFRAALIRYSSSGQWEFRAAQIQNRIYLLRGKSLTVKNPCRHDIISYYQVRINIILLIIIFRLWRRDVLKCRYVGYSPCGAGCQLYIPRLE